MSIIRSAAHIIDAKKEEEPRTRHILANSGDIMESGEIRPVEDLYVMDRDAKLIKIASLNKDPKKQTEKYNVRAQADHGLYDPATGELIPTVEKCFGSCKVWLEDDGLHALMTFAPNDKLADHCYAISKDASYSTGIDLYPDGYGGAGQAIDGPVAILREISMVVTGNDPRARTIDQKPAQAEAQRGAEAADGKNNRKEAEMPKAIKELNNLTPDEAAAFSEELLGVVKKFTTDAPESEIEPTADAKKDEAEEKKDEAEAPAKAEEKQEEEKKDTVHMPQNIIVVNDAVRQTVQKAADYRHSDKGRQAFRHALDAAGMQFGQAFENAYAAQAKKDGVTGLTDPCGVAQAFASALETSKGIISTFAKINTKEFTQRLMLEVTPDADNSRAAGHKKGDKKTDQEVKQVSRSILTLMVYKKLSFDAHELYENPELADFRAKELVDALFVEIERAAFIGDGRSSGTPDRRMYRDNRGFHSMAEDAKNIGSDDYAKAVIAVYENPVGKSFRNAIVGGLGKLKAEGVKCLVAKPSAITALKQAERADGTPLVSGKIEDYLGVNKIFTPAWMEKDTTNEAYAYVQGAYAMIGEVNNMRTRTAFDINTNEDALLDETPRGGSLVVAGGAVAIKQLAQ